MILGIQVPGHHCKPTQPAWHQYLLHCGPARGHKQRQIHEVEPVVTLFTADRVITFPSRTGGRLQLDEPLHGRPPLPTLQEQGLCMGATFWVAATNGNDPARRLNLLGFCRCIDSLSEVVESTVLQHGGAVTLREQQLKGLHNQLRLSVAIPLLWGIPPQHEPLKAAILHGGGFVEKAWKEWHMLR